MRNTVWLTLFVLVGLTWAAPVWAQVCVPPPPGMVGWWPGDGNANDISGQGHNGTLQGGVTFAPGKVGQAFSFNGVDGIVRISNAPNLQPQQLTIDAWVFPNGLGIDGGDFRGEVIVSKDIANVGVSYALFGPGTTNKFVATVDTVSGTRAEVVSTNSFPFNLFHHVAMT